MRSNGELFKECKDLQEKCQQKNDEILQQKA